VALEPRTDSLATLAAEHIKVSGGSIFLQ